MSPFEPEDDDPRILGIPPREFRRTFGILGVCATVSAVALILAVRAQSGAGCLFSLTTAILFFSILWLLMAYKIRATEMGSGAKAGLYIVSFLLAGVGGALLALGVCAAAAGGF